MESDFVFSKFMVLTGVVVGSVFVFRFFLKNEFERQFLYFGALGVYVWSGIGGSLRIVDWKYLVLFFVFFVLLFGTFTFTVYLLNKLVKPVRFFEGEALLSERFWNGFTIFFLLFSLFPLVYPEFHLLRLLRPPSPDIVQMVEDRFRESGDSLPEILFYYASVLMFPFFLFSLAFLGRRWWLVILCVFFYYYTRYCVDEYLPRHEIGLMLILLLLYFWNMRIFPRHFLAVVCLFALPILLFFFNVYTKLRQGVGMEIGLNLYGLIESVYVLFYQETFYPIFVDELINTSRTDEIFRYIKWIVSLPIPQNLTESWDYLQINYEFTEFATKRHYGHSITQVFLPSIFGEAIFIFGNKLFWIHAMVIGLLVGSLCFVLKSDPRLFFLMTFFQLQLLIMARGGIGKLLILIVNYFLLFWPFLFVLIRRSRTAARNFSFTGQLGYPGESPPETPPALDEPEAL